VSEPDIDPCTAPAQSVPHDAGRPTSLADCARAFLRQPSPPYLLGAVAITLVLRLVEGSFGWRDFVMSGALVAVTPLVEWAIHVYLLHLPPISIFGRRIEILTAREHRAHHEAPGVLEGVLLPVYGVLVFFVLIALINWALSFPIALVLGGPRLAYTTTALLISFVILTSYEWTHFLIHTPYRPKGRYLRAIWRNHRLHHYKNEHYWFGVTSTVADRVLGTLADQSSVARSESVRSLRIKH
jgi:hypothetical protein